jgi:hypothetical protein
MDLKQFVSGTITQIAEGIRDAQSKTEGTGAWVNPAGSVVTGNAVKDLKYVETFDTRAYLQEVKFDVALTVSDTQGAGAGGGLQVFGVKIGADTSVSYQNAAVSRVQFSIQVVWPGTVNAPFEERVKAANPR